MIDTEQKELETLRELEKVVRADRNGAIYVADSRHPQTNRWMGRHWVTHELVLARLDKLRDRERRPIP